MANDKDFKVKNGVQPTRYVEGLGTVVAGTDGPSGLFSTTLYTGTGASLAINNGLNLSGDGGLVWTKRRSSANSNWFLDSVRGGSQILRSNTTEAQFTSSGLEITSFNSNGYTLGTASDINNSSHTDVSWAFKKTANFFDIVTYAGNGSARSIAHNLGSVPGMIIIKGYDRSDGWAVYHRGHNGGTDPEDYVTFLSGPNAQSNSASHFNDTAPTSTHFTVGTESMVNDSSNNYVAYLFAHNNETINCGTYTGNGSATGPVVTTGFQPQWLLVKAASSSGDWWLVDSVRGVVDGGNDPRLLPNTTDAEATSNYVKFTSNGFQLEADFGMGNGSGIKYIYMAIAAVTDTDTLDLSTGGVFNYTPTASKTLKLSNPAATGTNSGATLLMNGNDLAGIAGNFSTRLWTGTGSDVIVQSGVDLTGQGSMVWVKNRSRGSTDHTIWTINDQAGWLKPNTTAAITNQNWVRDWTTTTYTASGNSTSYASYSGDTYVGWAFKKTAKFFDVVTYTGNATVRTIAHDLGQVPGMIIVKKTSGTGAWYVFHRSSTDADGKIGLQLNSSDAQSDFGNVHWDVSEMSSTHFGLGNMGNLNGNGSTYIAYLFGHNTSSGPIQCGSYTGNGSATGPVVTTGFQPQWLMFKCTSNADDWVIVDAQRGIDPAGNDIFLKPNTTGADYGFLDAISVSSTGFNVTGTDNVVNGSGRTYIYMAIAAEEGASTTYDSSIKWSGGTAPTSPAVGETDVITLDTTDGGTTYRAAHAIDGAK